MNVGCLVEVFNHSFEAFEAALKDSENTSNGLVVPGICCNLFLDSFHDVLDEFNHCQNEGAKGKTSSMESEGSVVAGEHWGAEFILGSMTEIPHAATTGDNKDSQCLQKSIGPESPEEEVVKEGKASLGVAIKTSENIIISNERS